MSNKSRRNKSEITKSLKRTQEIFFFFGLTRKITAQVNQLLGSPSDSISDYNYFLETPTPSPDEEAEVLFLRGRAHFDAGNLKFARTDFERARRGGFNEKAVVGALAEVNLALGDFLAAVKLLTDLATNSDGDEFVNLVERRGWVRIGAGLADDALKDFQILNERGAITRALKGVEPCF